MPKQIPLFPLGTVLYPGGPLALRIFEPRYVDMVGRCLQSGSGFGVAAIRAGSEVGEAATYEVGTLAEMVDWYQLEGGLLGITVVGRERFRLHRTTRRPDGLYVAEVSLLAPEPHIALSREHGRMAALLRRLLAPLGSHYQRITEAYDDASWVGYRLAEVLPLPVPFKQSLLELEDPPGRLDRLHEQLELTDDR